jgi:hypothetical protein
VVQFNAVKKQFVATCKVPIAASHEKSELTFIFELGNRQRTFEEPASTFGLAVSWAAFAACRRHHPV